MPQLAEITIKKFCKFSAPGMSFAIYVSVTKAGVSAVEVFALMMALLINTILPGLSGSAFTVHGWKTITGSYQRDNTSIGQ